MFCTNKYVLFGSLVGFLFVSQTFVVMGQQLPALRPTPEFKPKSVVPSTTLERSEYDIRRQKEEAAKSLNRTLKEIDERTRTKAIESGKSVIIQ